MSFSANNLSPQQKQKREASHPPAPRPSVFVALFKEGLSPSWLVGWALFLGAIASAYRSGRGGDVRPFTWFAFDFMTFYGNWPWEISLGLIGVALDCLVLPYLTTAKPWPKPWPKASRSDNTGDLGRLVVEHFYALLVVIGVSSGPFLLICGIVDLCR